MNNLKNNKKGFTLIELLAVIVILAILVAVAIPATMRYLNQARAGTFVSNANEALSQVRNDATVADIQTNVYYTLEQVNDLLHTDLASSPWGKKYKGLASSDTSHSYISVEYDSSTYTRKYHICLDDGTYILDVDEGNIDTAHISTPSTGCTYPSGYKAVVVDTFGVTPTKPVS